MKLNTVLTVPDGLKSAGEKIRVGGTTDRPLFDAVDIDRLCYLPEGNRRTRTRHSCLNREKTGWIGKRQAITEQGVREHFWVFSEDKPLLKWLSSENLRLIRSAVPVGSSPTDFWNETHMRLMLSDHPKSFSVLSGAYWEITTATAARHKVLPDRHDRLDTVLGRRWKQFIKGEAVECRPYRVPLWLPEQGKLARVHVYDMTALPLFRKWLSDELAVSGDVNDWKGTAWEAIDNALFGSSPADSSDVPDNWQGQVTAKVLGFCQVTGTAPQTAWSAIYKAYEAITGDNVYETVGMSPLEYIRYTGSGGALLDITDRVLGEWLPDFKKALKVEMV